MAKALDFRRRREALTDYKRRLALVKSGMDRVVVRKTNKRIIGQIIRFNEKGDVVLSSADSNELRKAYGWPSRRNKSTAYLTGLLLAKKAKVKRYIYASSCSVYGYTVNELFDETQPVSSTYPYGISKLQGEQAVMNLRDEAFSVISLRKGTVSGWSPRMRLDLIINTMFRNGIRNGEITVDNPSIWRPIISIEDAANAYIRAIEASEKISGIFNVAGGNYTVGEVGDLVKMAIEEELGKPVHLTIDHKLDFRNYKVSIEKAENVLSFHPHHGVKRIVKHLIEHMGEFNDWDNPYYYNIETLKRLSARSGLRNLAEVAG